MGITKSTDQILTCPVENFKLEKEKILFLIENFE